MTKKPLLVFATCLWLSTTLHATPLQNPEQVAQIVEEYLLSQASSYLGSATVHVSPPDVSNQAACTQFQPFLSSDTKLRPVMTVSVRCQAPEPWTLRVKTELSIDGYYYVSNRNLPVGQMLSLDDLIPREGDLLRLPTNTITDLSLAVGHITKQRINAGNAIKSTALRDPQSIERGQMVRTVAHGTGFMATGEGKALQNGSPGSQIQVRVGSGRVITGIVLDAQTVQVF